MPDLSLMAAEESVVGAAGKKKVVMTGEGEKQKGRKQGISSKSNGVETKQLSAAKRGRQMLAEFREKKGATNTGSSGPTPAAEDLAPGANGAKIKPRVRKTGRPPGVDSQPTTEVNAQDKAVISTANGRIAEGEFSGNQSFSIGGDVEPRSLLRGQVEVVSLENGSSTEGQGRGRSSSAQNLAAVEPSASHQEHPPPPPHHQLQQQQQRLGADGRQTTGGPEASRSRSPAQGSGHGLLPPASSLAAGPSLVHHTVTLPVVESVSEVVDGGRIPMKSVSAASSIGSLSPEADPYTARSSASQTLSASEVGHHLVLQQSVSVSRPLIATSANGGDDGSSRLASTSTSAATSSAAAAPINASSFSSNGSASESAALAVLPSVPPSLSSPGEQRVVDRKECLQGGGHASNDLSNGGVISLRNSRPGPGMVASSSSTMSETVLLEGIPTSNVPYNSFSSSRSDAAPVSGVGVVPTSSNDLPNLPNLPNLPWRGQSGQQRKGVVAVAGVAGSSTGTDISGEGAGPLRHSDGGKSIGVLRGSEGRQRSELPRENATMVVTSREGSPLEGAAPAQLGNVRWKEDTALPLPSLVLEGGLPPRAVEEPAGRYHQIQITPAKDGISRSRASSFPSLSFIPGAAAEPPGRLSFTSHHPAENNATKLESLMTSTELASGTTSASSSVLNSFPHMAGPGRATTPLFASALMPLLRPSSTSSLSVSPGLDLPRKPTTTGSLLLPLSSSIATPPAAAPSGGRSSTSSSPFTTPTKMFTSGLPRVDHASSPTISLFSSPPARPSDGSRRPVTPPLDAGSSSSAESHTLSSLTSVAPSGLVLRQSESARDGTDPVRQRVGGGAVPAVLPLESGVLEDTHVQRAEEAGPKTSLKPSVSNDFSALEQHIEDLTQEKYALQRAVDAARLLSESLAKENSQLTDDFNSQGAVVNQLREELNRLREELRSQQAVLSSLRAEKDKAVVESGAVAARVKAMANEVIVLEEKVLRLRSSELKLEHELEKVAAELETQRRQNASVAADRTNLRSMVEILQEEKKVLLTKIKKSPAASPVESPAQQPAVDVRKTADASTSTDDLEISSEVGTRNAGSTVDSSAGTPAADTPAAASPSMSGQSMSPEDWRSFRPDEGLMTLESGTVLPVSKSAIPPDELVLIESVNAMLSQLASEKKKLARSLEEEVAAAAKLRAANMDLSRKLAAQTQRLELVVSQNMVRGNSEAAIQRSVAQDAEPEPDQGLDEGDEVVDRVLDWIMRLFPRNRGNRRTMVKLQ